MTEPAAPDRPIRGGTRLGTYLSEELEELIEALDPNPAYIVDRTWEVLGANRSARSLFRDWPLRPTGIERNLLWFYCCDPAARTLFVDWEQEAADQVELFRIASIQHHDDARYEQVLEQVVAGNPKVSTWWREHVLVPHRGRMKRIRLATGQVVSLRQLILAALDDPDVHVVCYFAGIDAGADDGLDDDDGDLE